MCMVDGPISNDMKKSNIPDLRINYRCDMLSRERLWVSSLGKSSFYSSVLSSILTTLAPISTTSANTMGELDKLEDDANFE